MAARAAAGGWRAIANDSTQGASCSGGGELRPALARAAPPPGSRPAARSLSRVPQQQHASASFIRTAVRQCEPIIPRCGSAVATCGAADRRSAAGPRLPTSPPACIHPSLAGAMSCTYVIGYVPDKGKKGKCQVRSCGLRGLRLMGVPPWDHGIGGGRSAPAVSCSLRMPQLAPSCRGTHAPPPAAWVHMAARVPTPLPVLNARHCMPCTRAVRLLPPMLVCCGPTARRPPGPAQLLASPLRAAAVVGLLFTTITSTQATCLLPWQGCNDEFEQTVPLLLFSLSECRHRMASRRAARASLS